MNIKDFVDKVILLDNGFYSDGEVKYIEGSGHLGRASPYIKLSMMCKDRTEPFLYISKDVIQNNSWKELEQWLEACQKIAHYLQ